MNIETVILPADDDYPLQIIANRYKPALSNSTSTKGDTVVEITLILAHATSVHKETWEPVLQHVFSQVATGRNFAIIEAWAIEAPNHGRSAVLNEEVLYRDHREECMCILDYPRCHFQPCILLS